MENASFARRFVRDPQGVYGDKKGEKKQNRENQYNSNRIRSEDIAALSGAYIRKKKQWAIFGTSLCYN